MDGGLGDSFFQGFADLLAESVQQELINRHMGLLISYDEPPRNAIQVSVTGWDWPNRLPQMSAREFLWKYVRGCAVEMGTKLARPAVLTTYAMDVPRGVEAAAVGYASDLVLRCLVDYSLQTDSMVLRVDALAKWDF